MFETILVFLIVGTALVLVCRSAWRSVSGNGKGCGCSNGGCALSGVCKTHSKQYEK